MAQITIHGGDVDSGEARLTADVLSLPKSGTLLGEDLPAAAIEAIEVLTERNVKMIGSAAAGTVLGALIAGPLGGIVGALSFGNRSEVNFVASLDDGRSFVGSTDSATFAKLKAASLREAPIARRMAVARMMRRAERRSRVESDRNQTAADALRDMFE